MKKEIFETVLVLSKQTGDVTWEIYCFMKILLKEDEVDLDKLKDNLSFFSMLMSESESETERYSIAKTRYIYLKNRFGLYFED